jgi:protein-disulfide isomerase
VPIALLLSLLLAAGAAPSVSAQSQEPELTWAPLVTLPPIATPPVLTPVDLADGTSLGSPDAPVAIEVWEDFQCPYCQRFTFQIEPAIVDAYVSTGKARLTFRNLAFLGEESHWAAVAASLAADQGLFWPYHDYLFGNLLGENVGSYGLDRLLAIGEAVGLDMTAFRAGLVLDAARARFAEIDAQARTDAERLGISATPTVTVNGVPLESPDFETVSAAVDAALAQLEAPPSAGAGAPTSPAPTAAASAAEASPVAGASAAAE